MVAETLSHLFSHFCCLSGVCYWLSVSSPPLLFLNLGVIAVVARAESPINAQSAVIIQ